MKKTIQFLIFTLVFLLGNSAQAQTAARMKVGATTNCLTAVFVTEGTLVSDSCATVKWTVKNGTNATGNGNKFTYTFSTAGTYMVCAKLINTCKKFDTTVCISVTVVSCDCKLTTEFSFKNDCKKASFVASSNQKGTTYSWNFGDKTEGKGTDPKHTYMSEGVYKVCVTASWKDSTTGKVCTATFCKEIKISCGNPCNLKGELGFTNTGGKVRFKASSNSGYSYEWNFGDGKTGKGIDPYHEYSKPGSYTACVTITDKTGKCKIKICKTVVVESPCNLIGSYSSKKLNDSTYKFYATSNGGTKATFFWTWGDGTSSTGRNASHVYKKSGFYEVCLKIYNPTKKCYTRICKKVEITVPTTTTKCNWSAAGANLTYTNKCNVFTFEGKNMGTTTNCFKYAIVVGNNGATTTYNSRTATHTFKNTGTYTVCIKYTDLCKSCDTTICTSVKVDCSPCTAKASFTVDSIASNGKMYVKNTSTGAKSYVWNFGDSSALSKDKTPVHQFAASGGYKVCLTAYDSSGTCSTVYCYTVKIVKTRSSKSDSNGSLGNSYPNPADAGFYVNLGSEKSTYIVYSSTGQIITQGNNSGTQFLDSKTWAEGIYQISIKSANGYRTESVIITH